MSSMSDMNHNNNPLSHIDSKQWELLKKLQNVMTEWNTKVNLISRKDIDNIYTNHILPCISISCAYDMSNVKTVIDVGTGGGLPGLPLAILYPNIQFTLLDSNKNKMIAVEDMKNQLGLTNVNVIRDRSENIDKKYDIVFGRSVR